MILPTDYNLLESVSFYDAVQSKIFFKKEYWSGYFPRLLHDFRFERSCEPITIPAFVKDVKIAFFNYYYLKFVVEKKTNLSLHNMMSEVFDRQQKLSNENGKEWRAAAVLPSGESGTILTFPDEKPKDTYVDQLLDDFKAVERTSVRELDLHVAFDQFATQYGNEEAAIQQLKDKKVQHELEQYFVAAPNSGLVGAITTVYKLSEASNFTIGFPTLMNALDHDGVFYDMSKDFDIDRFHIFVQYYNNYDVFRRLIQKIGKDVCAHLYQKFMRDGRLYYSNIDEYVFSSLIVMDLRSRCLVAQRQEHPWFGVLSRYDMKRNHQNRGLFERSTHNSSVTMDERDFRDTGSQEVGFSRSYNATRFGETGRFGQSSPVVQSPVPLSPTTSTSGSSYQSGFGGRSSNTSFGSSSYSGFGGSKNPR